MESLPHLRAVWKTVLNAILGHLGHPKTKPTATSIQLLFVILNTGAFCICSRLQLTWSSTVYCTWISKAKTILGLRPFLWKHQNHDVEGKQHSSAHFSELRSWSLWLWKPQRTSFKLHFHSLLWGSLIWRAGQDDDELRLREMIFPVGTADVVMSTDCSSCRFQLWDSHAWSTLVTKNSCAQL